MRPRMLPGPSPEGLKMAPRTTSGLKFMRCVFWSCKSGMHRIGFFAFWLIFGTRPGPENRPKSALWPKRRPQRRCQKRFLCLCCFFFRFFLPFEAKIRPKINEKLKVLFRFCVRFFQTRESQILCTGAVFWAVFTFLVFAIFCQKWPKERAKKACHKKTQKMEAPDP